MQTEDGEESYLPPQRQRKANTPTSPLQATGHPPHAAAPTIWTSESPDPTPTLPEPLVWASESLIQVFQLPMQVPGSPVPSLGMTEPATPQSAITNPDLDSWVFSSRRLQLADPDSDAGCFLAVILKMLQNYSPKARIQEEEHLN